MKIRLIARLLIVPDTLSKQVSEYPIVGYWINRTEEVFFLLNVSKIHIILNVVQGTLIFSRKLPRLMYNISKYIVIPHFLVVRKPFFPTCLTVLAAQAGR